MSQINLTHVNTAPASSVNSDVSVNSSNTEAKTSASSAALPAEIPHEEPASLGTEVNQVQQRLQALLTKASTKGVAGFTQSLSETIKSEMKTRFTAGFRDKPALLKAAQRCDEAAKKLGSLVLKDLIYTELSDNAFDTIQDYVLAQHELYAAVKQVAEKQKNPSPFLNSLLQATQFRACEALNITGSMQQLAQKLKKIDLDPQEITRHLGALNIEKSVLQGMQVLSPAMHGHVLADKLKESAANLFGKIKTLEAQKEEVALDTFKASAQALKSDLDTLKAKVDSLGASVDQPAQDDKPKMQMDINLYNVLKPYVDRMEARLSAMGTVSAQAQISKAIDDFLPKLPVDFQDYIVSSERGFSKKAADLKTAFQEFNTKISTLRENVKTGCTAAALNSALTEALGVFKTAQAQRALRSVFLAANALIEADDNKTAYSAFTLTPDARKKIENFIETISIFSPKQQGILDAQKDEVVAMQTKLAGSSASLKPEYILDALEHNVNVNLLVEAQLRNIPYEQLQVTAGENILKSSRVLGQGAANTVNLCSYRGADGENLTLVFKPESNARFGLAGLAAGGLGYQNNTRVMQINIAACYSAESIGCENVIAKSKIGSFKGKIGLFMDAAPGATFNNIACEKSTLCGINSRGERFTYRDTCALLQKKGLYSTMQANLMQELNKLEWADILSGQVDRHGDNYLVSIDADTGAVKVTGIDNDASFGSRKIGMNTIDLEGVAPKGIAFLKMKRLPINEQKILDASGANSSQIEGLRRIFGFNQFLVPARIDKGTFDKLMAVDTGAYRQKLLTCLDREAAEAAVLRLEDAKQHAQRLAYQGKVVDDWKDPKVYQEMKTEVAQRQGSDTAKYLRTGFYQRDFMTLK